MSDVKITNTPYDDVFRTLLNDCSSLIIPVINEIFGENYSGKEKIGFYWVPFGYRTEWNFHIRVKSSVFQSLKYEKSKSYLDNYY